MPELDRKDGLCILMLALVVGLFFHQFILFGRVPINADWLHANFQPGRSYIDAKAHNSELDDPIYQFYPLRMEALRQWRAGEVPLWNPRILCGSPLLADGISKPFDPLIVMQLVFGGAVGRGLELFSQFLLMASGAYLVARALALSRPAAVLAALVYTFNLLAVTWMELRTATGAFAFFPWAFLFLFAAIETNRLSFAVAAGLAAGAMALAGHPQFVLYGFACLGAFVLWRAVAGWRDAGGRQCVRVVWLGAVALVLGVMLSGVETVPFLELAGNTARSARQYERLNFASTPLTFITWLFPNFFGSPVKGGFVGGALLLRPYMTATAGFVGASTYVFALLGAVCGRVRFKGFLLAVIVAVIGLLMAAGAGVFIAVPVLGRFFSGMDISRLAFLSNFAVAILAGAGAQALVRAADGKSAVKVVFLAALPVAVIPAVVLFIRALAGPLCFWDKRQTDMLLSYVAAVAPGPLGVLLLPAVYVPLMFLAAGALLVVLGRRLGPAAAWVAAVLVAVELTVAGLGYNPFVARELVAPDFPFLKALSVEPGRGRVLGVDTPSAGRLVASKGDFLVPNTASLYGLEDIRGDESLRLERFHRYALGIVDGTVSLLASTHTGVFDSPLVDAANVKYIMAAVPLSAAHLRPVYSDGRAFVYENTRALPRAYVVGNFLEASSANDALNIIQADAALKLDETVVLELGGAEAPAVGGSGATGAARIIEYAPSKVIVEATCGQDSLLVLADAFYTGWRASVDGVDTPIFPANGAFRAVGLAAGEHRIVFTYRPASFLVGAALSAAAGFVAVGVLAATALSVARRRRARTCGGN